MKIFFFILSIYFCNFIYSEDTQILLIRHGETAWNVEKRVLGHANISLNEKGQAQARLLAEKLLEYHPDIAAIYSSDLDRAHFTAQETAAKFNLPIEKITPQLREISYGITEGLSMSEFFSKYGLALKNHFAKYPDRKQRWEYSPIPGGETYNELLKRMQNELKAYAEAHPGKKIAVFSHGRVIKTLKGECLDQETDQDIPNCGVAVFLYSLENSEKPLTFVQVEDFLNPV